MDEFRDFVGIGGDGKGTDKSLFSKKFIRFFSSWLMISVSFSFEFFLSFLSGNLVKGRNSSTYKLLRDEFGELDGVLPSDIELTVESNPWKSDTIFSELLCSTRIAILCADRFGDSAVVVVDVVVTVVETGFWFSCLLPAT